MITYFGGRRPGRSTKYQILIIGQSKEKGQKWRETLLTNSVIEENCKIFVLTPEEHAAERDKKSLGKGFTQCWIDEANPHWREHYPDKIA